MRHIVMYSGGVNSWATAKWVVDTHGTADVVLLFTDTRVEDADLYRFLDDGARVLGLTITRLAEGRTPWQVFGDEHLIGNNRAAICSRILKQEPARAWVKANCDPASTTLYLGIDWMELHRLEPAQRAWQPYTVRAPLCEPPYPSKHSHFATLAALGIEPPRLYARGYAHNNCGGACVRAGQAAWIHLLKDNPALFAEHEREEQAFRERFGKDVAILRDRTGGDAKPLTLTALRERYEAQPQTLDLFDWGGCGCFLDDEAS